MELPTSHIKIGQRDLIYKTFIIYIKYIRYIRPIYIDKEVNTIYTK